MTQRELNNKLLASIIVGVPEKAKESIKAGADVNFTDHLGWTPLHEAVWVPWAGIDIVKILLEAGSNPKAIDIEGKTPLYYAARWEHTGIVELLEEAMKEAA